MGNTYTVQILNDKEFDSLPYKGISDSLGIADKAKGLAFVRDTGVKEFNLATLSHEIDHLVSKNTNHTDEYGIAHKKGGAARFIVPALLALVPGVGPVLAAAANVGMNQAAQKRHPEELGKPSIGSAVGQAATGYFGGKALAGGVSGGITGGTAAGEGFLSKGAGILGGVGKGAMTGSAGLKLQGATPAVPGAITAPALKAPGLDLTTPSFSASGPASILARGGMPAASTPMAAASPAALPGILGNLGNATSAVNSFSPAVNPAAATLPSVTPPNILGGGGGAPTPPKPSFMDKVGQFASQPTNLLGAGALASSMAPQTPQFEMPPIVSDLRSKLMAGEALSPLGQQARSSLSEIMSAKPTELFAPAKDEYYQAVLRRTRTAYQEAQKNLDAAYNQAGVYGSGEHLAAKDKLNQQLTNAETDLFAQTEQRNFELARSQQYQAIQDSLGVDKDQMDDLVGLTGLDVQTAAMVYGAKVEDVKQIRDSLGTLGMELLMRGKGGTQSASGLTINMGK